MIDREFLDFAIRVEFQTDRGTDTGVDLIDFDPDGGLRNCTEVDIHHTRVPGTPDDKVGEVWNWGKRIPVHCVSRDTVDLKGDSSWQIMEIQRQQGLLSVTVNDRKLANRVQVAPSPSWIGFEGEVGKARYRNIEVIELPQL